MLMLYRLILIVFLTATYSTASFSRTAFTEGYEAAQSGNYKRAVSLWTPLAENGDTAAQYTLAWMFESGQGVKQSYKKAAFWYTKAAEQGDVASQYVLAGMYIKGIGVKQDETQAVYWFTKAANDGDAVAQFKLGVHYQNGIGVEQDYDKSIFWFQKAAAQGHIISQINLGKIYQTGKGIKVDYKKAIEWYEKAAKQNNAFGQYHLAHMYDYGRGVNQDFEKAKSLYLQSANNHYAPSAYKVAEFYEMGKGVDIDYKRAAKWYRKSALKGNSSAQFKLGNLYKEGKGVNKDIRNAIEWYNLAANQNHVQSYYQLGVIYDEGIKNKHKAQRIKVNYKKALQYFQKASELDSPAAHARLASLYEKGSGTEVNLAKAMALYQKSTEPWAIERYQQLSKQLNCYETATTKLFSVTIACTTREILREKIKEQNIVAIDENTSHWTDSYFTGAIIKGSSQLQVTYTREDLFVSAKYTFVGRNNPSLIGKVKNKLVKRYGQPTKIHGEENKGPASFEWLLDDGIHLTVNRLWPDTTTFVVYTSPEKKQLLEAQQKQSNSKTFTPYELEKDNLIESDLF